MPVPFEVVKILPQERVDNLRAHLKEVYLDGVLLTPDVSNYAQGRQRCWLETEAPLGPTRPWSKAFHDEKLWAWIKGWVWPDADLGLVTYGPVGIKPHRDASYADYEAWSVNLGTIEGWWYEPGYHGYAYGPQEIREPITYTLDPGTIIRFNCKNRHAVINPAEDRWSINLWRYSSRMRPAYNHWKFLNP